MLNLRQFAAAAVSAASLVWAAMPAQAELRLVMVEQAGCSYCALWEKQIGPIYPKTQAGRTAPLLHTDLHGPLPENVSFNYPARLTPTFVLIEDGKEIWRLEGYPGEDFFWGLVDKRLSEHPDWALHAAPAGAGG